MPLGGRRPGRRPGLPQPPATGSAARRTSPATIPTRRPVDTGPADPPARPQPTTDPSTSRLTQANAAASLYPHRRPVRPRVTRRRRAPRCRQVGSMQNRERSRRHGHSHHQHPRHRSASHPTAGAARAAAAAGPLASRNRSSGRRLVATFSGSRRRAPWPHRGPGHLPWADHPGRAQPGRLGRCSPPRGRGRSSPARGLVPPYGRPHHRADQSIPEPRGLAGDPAGGNHDSGPDRDGDGSRCGQ